MKKLNNLNNNNKKIQLLIDVTKNQHLITQKTKKKSHLT